jgi:hypothetical protein
VSSAATRATALRAACAIHWRIPALEARKGCRQGAGLGR